MRGQRHAPAAFYPRERPDTHYTGGWVGPRVGLDRCGKSHPTGIRSQDRPVRSQSLYRLRYPEHMSIYRAFKKNVAVSRINKKCICYLTRAKRTPSAAETVQVFNALIIILQCVHPGSHDTHPHDNRIRPRLGVSDVMVCSSCVILSRTTLKDVGNGGT
jgi:hypothetical protein